MKILTVVRHAKSSWDAPELSDWERPLNDRGERNAPVMGVRMCSSGILPGLIVSSTAVRAWHTAQLIAEQLDYPMENILPEKRLYHASVPEILEVVSEQDPDYDHLMIVGHNPGLTDFVNCFSPGLTWNVPTAGIASFKFDQTDWDITESSEADLVYYDYPKKKRKSKG
jgi:phosphohistidine phosphatase